MGICPNCKEEYDETHYKKRGNCNICGFKFSASDVPDVSTTPNNSTNKAPSGGSKLKKTNLNALKEAKPQVTAPQADLTVLEKKQQQSKEALKPPKNVKPVSTHSVTHKQDEHTRANENVSHSQSSSSAKPLLPEDDEDYKDPIFLNPAGMLQFDEDDDEDNTKKNISDTPTANKNSDSGKKNAQTLNDSHIVSLAAKAKKIKKKFSIKKDNNNTHKKISNVFPFSVFFLAIRKYKYARTEELEDPNIKYDFNQDGFYNDTIPKYPPQIDVIHPETILKTVASIIGIILFISLLVYLAPT